MGQFKDLFGIKCLFVSELVMICNDLAIVVLKVDFKWVIFEFIIGWQCFMNEGCFDFLVLYVLYFGQIGIVNLGYVLDYSFFNCKLLQEF